MYSKKSVLQTPKNMTSLEEVYWEDVRELMVKSNPDLANIIDEINPGKKLTLIKAQYPFGVDIRHKGRLFLPTNQGTVVPFDHDSISTNIRTQLDYSPMPLAFIADKAVEIYVEKLENRVVPLKLFTAGTTIGVWDMMDAPQISMRYGWHWSISSGARSLFMLPKITDSASHERLKNTYQIKTHLPHSLFEHHRIFTELTYSEKNHSCWGTTILFFTKDWKELPDSNMGWLKLKNYWAQEAWQQMHQWTNKVVMELNWEAFLSALAKRKQRLQPYLLDTLKHLLSIGSGTIPGFVFTNIDDTIAPIHFIQQAYLEGYNLKNYIPLMMHPALLTTENRKRVVYYSLNMPTLPERPAESQHFPSMMKMLRELKALMDIYLELAKTWPPIETNDNVYDFLTNVSFDYFHSDHDKWNIIRKTSDLLIEDSAIEAVKRQYPDRALPINSYFFKGCIKISLSD